MCALAEASASNAEEGTFNTKAAAEAPAQKAHLGVCAAHGWGRILSRARGSLRASEKCHIYNPPSHPHILVAMGIQ